MQRRRRGDTSRVFDYRREVRTGRLPEANQRDRGGLKGLIVFIDEAVNLYKIIQSASRESNYEKLTIFNDATLGKLSHIAFFFGGTPQFLEDTRRGLFSYEALRSRLSDNRFNAAGRLDYSPRAEASKCLPPELLAPFKEDFDNTFGTLRMEPRATDALSLQALSPDLTGRMGATAC